MPSILPNGVTIFNATPHELVFEMEDGELITAKTDVVLHCKPLVQLERKLPSYTFNSVIFTPTAEGQRIIDYVNEHYPDAVIIGSMIAAQAYAGSVAIAVPVQGGRLRRNNKQSFRPVRPDRFTIYKENNHG